jgi:site-specific recombinase XerD
MLRKRQPKVFSLEMKNYVFPKHPGLRYERDFVSKQFKKAVRVAGLNEGLHFHSLRHSTASNMVRRGVPIAVVKEVLGHLDIKTTMGYSHVRQEDLVNAVKMLEPTS